MSIIYGILAGISVVLIGLLLIVFVIIPFASFIMPVAWGLWDYMEKQGEKARDWLRGRK